MMAACVSLHFFRALLSCDDLIQCSGAAAERFYFQAEVLKHRDEEVAERLVSVSGKPLYGSANLIRRGQSTGTGFERTDRSPHGTFLASIRTACPLVS